MLLAGWMVDCARCRISIEMSAHAAAESRFLAFTLHDQGQGCGDLYAAFNAHSFEARAAWQQRAAVCPMHVFAWRFWLSLMPFYCWHPAGARATTTAAPGAQVVPPGGHGAADAARLHTRRQCGRGSRIWHPALLSHCAGGQRTCAAAGRVSSELACTSAAAVFRPGRHVMYSCISCPLFVCSSVVNAKFPVAVSQKLDCTALTVF